MPNLFLKIQTKTIYDTIEEYPRPHQEEASRMYNNYIENYKDIPFEEYFEKNLSTKIPFCKVIAVGVGVENEDSNFQTVVSVSVDNEEKLLKDFADVLNTNKFKFSNIIGYNIQEEVFILFNKFIQYDIDVPRPISHPFNCKPWESNMYDILQKVSFGKQIPYLNFKRLLISYGIEFSNNIIDPFNNSLIGIENSKDEYLEEYKKGFERELKNIHSVYQILNQYIS